MSIDTKKVELLLAVYEARDELHSAQSFFGDVWARLLEELQRIPPATWLEILEWLLRLVRGDHPFGPRSESGDEWIAKAISQGDVQAAGIGDWVKVIQVLFELIRWFRDRR